MDEAKAKTRALSTAKHSFLKKDHHNQNNNFRLHVCLSMRMSMVACTGQASVCHRVNSARGLINAILGKKSQATCLLSILKPYLSMQCCESRS